MIKSVRDNAEKAALSQGFSSLQEVVRIFLYKFASQKLSVTIQESVQLSDKAEKKYLKMEQDFKEHKETLVAESVDDLMLQLDENSLS